MFATMTTEQRALFRRDAARSLFQAFVLGPALLVTVAWVIWWASSLIGLPGNDLAQGFLGDSFGLLVVIQTHVLAAMAIPAVASGLSDPAGTRLAMWTLTACLFSLLPQVFWLMEAVGNRAAKQPLPAPLDGGRFDTRTQPLMPALRFCYGTSPQLE